jgi:hypothetical protein
MVWGKVSLFHSRLSRLCEPFDFIALNTVNTPAMEKLVLSGPQYDGSYLVDRLPSNEIEQSLHETVMDLLNAFQTGPTSSIVLALLIVSAKTRTMTRFGSLHRIL